VLLIPFPKWPIGCRTLRKVPDQRGGIECSDSWIYLVLRRCPLKSAGDMKLGACLQIPLAWYRPTDFYHCDLMPTSKISAHATEWSPAKMLPIGPRTC